MNRTGILHCGAAAVLFGISAPLASLLTDDMGAFTLAGLLYIGAAIAVVPFVGRTPPTRRAVRSSLPNPSLAVHGLSDGLDRRMARPAVGGVARSPQLLPVF